MCWLFLRYGLLFHIQCSGTREKIMIFSTFYWQAHCFFHRLTFHILLAGPQLLSQIQIPHSSNRPNGRQMLLSHQFPSHTNWKPKKIICTTIKGITHQRYHRSCLICHQPTIICPTKQILQPIKFTTTTFITNNSFYKQHVRGQHYPGNCQQKTPQPVWIDHQSSH